MKASKVNQTEKTSSFLETVHLRKHGTEACKQQLVSRKPSTVERYVAGEGQKKAAKHSHTLQLTTTELSVLRHSLTCLVLSNSTGVYLIYKTVIKLFRLDPQLWMGCTWLAGSRLYLGSNYSSPSVCRHLALTQIKRPTGNSLQGIS